MIGPSAAMAGRLSQWAAVRQDDVPRHDALLVPGEHDDPGHAQARQKRRRGAVLVAALAVLGVVLLARHRGDEEAPGIAASFSAGFLSLFSPDPAATTAQDPAAAVGTWQDRFNRALANGPAADAQWAAAPEPASPAEAQRRFPTAAAPELAASAAPEQAAASGSVPPAPTAGPDHTEFQLTLPGDLCSFDLDWSSTTSPVAKCFCKLADNAGCSDKPCECQQGCDGTAWDHPRSVSLENISPATACSNGQSTALLTIPKSYMRDIGYVKKWCPRGAMSLLTELLEQGFQSYQEKVAGGPVKQCIHQGLIASVPWLHVHTIGEGGTVDNMFETNVEIWCHDLQSASEAKAKAEQILEWAGGKKVEELRHLPMEPPATCGTMGCGTWGPFGRCSCVPECRQWGICCEDFRAQCPS